MSSQAGAARTIWHDDAFVFLLAAGAVAIGFAPIFVRLASTGPIATAFWRMALAVPILWMFVRRQNAGSIRSASLSIAFGLAGGLRVRAGFGHLAHFDPTHIGDECDLARQLRRVASAGLLLVLSSPAGPPRAR